MPIAAQLAVAVVVAILCAYVAFLFFWRLELWAAGKASEDAHQALRRPCGASVDRGGDAKAHEKARPVTCLAFHRHQYHMASGGAGGNKKALIVTPKTVTPSLSLSQASL